MIHICIRTKPAAKIFIQILLFDKCVPKQLGKVHKDKMAITLLSKVNECYKKYKLSVDMYKGWVERVIILLLGDY